MQQIINRDIITEFGLDKLAPERQQELFGKIGELIFQGVLIRVLDSMSEEKQAELNSFLEAAGEDGGKIVSYLEANVPQFNEVVEQEIIKFKKESLDILSALNK